MVNALLDIETSSAAVHEFTALQFAFAVHAFFGFAACVQAFAAILIITGDIDTCAITKLARRIAYQRRILVDASAAFAVLIRVACVIAATAVLAIDQKIHAFAVTLSGVGIFAIDHDILAFAIDAVLIAGAGFDITATAVQRIGLGVETGIIAAARLIFEAAFVAANQIFRCTDEGVVAGFVRFAAIGRIVVAIEIAALALAAAADAEHICVAFVSEIAAMLCIAHQIVATAFEQGIIIGAANHTFSCLARFIFFALCRTVAAVTGIGLDIDAIAHTEFLVIGCTQIIGRLACAIHTGLVRIAHMPAAAAVL